MIAGTPEYMQTINLIQIIFAVLLLFGASCASHGVLQSPVVHLGAAPIANDVRVEPGSVAWSPDGSQIAYLARDAVMLRNIQTGQIQVIELSAPRFLAWPDAETITVLAGADHERALYAIDAERFRIRASTPLPDAIAIYPDADGALIVAARIRPFSFGRELSIQLVEKPARTGHAAPLYEQMRVIPPRLPDAGLLFAWTHADLHPLDLSRLVIEHIRPPVIAPYSRVLLIDRADGAETELIGRDQQTVYVSAAWSPEGTALALTLSDGRIEIRTRNGRLLTSAGPFGYFPSWGPRDVIYVGGAFIDRSGAVISLFRTAPSSIGYWSPDGVRIAVAFQGGLWLMDAPAPRERVVVDAAVKQKIARLRGLYRDGFIDADEYRQRTSRLREGRPQ